MGRPPLLLPSRFVDRGVVPVVSDGNENARPEDQGDGLVAQARALVSDAGTRRSGVPI